MQELIRPMTSRIPGVCKAYEHFSSGLCTDVSKIFEEACWTLGVVRGDPRTRAECLDLVRSR